ncbi:PASTA domain-containing protein [Nocardioides aquiterrae]|uniref:PASTA domain-containing protein n=1 Tax=Nocardioides aquiterrae TaxID=203799 RepID=A0ABP4F2Q9_9ACTN
MRLWLVALLVPIAACSDDRGEWWQEPPAGSRWVGYDGAVVAVPDWWTTGETQCGEPVEDTVYVDSGAIYDCANPADPAVVAEVSSLAVSSEGGRAVFEVTIADQGDGDEEQILGSRRQLPEGVTTVPLAVAGGWTPAWGADPRTVRDLTAAIEAAGLGVRLETVEPDPNGDVADLAPGSLLDVEPALGTPVVAGSTVVLKVMGGGTSGP